MDGTGLFGVIVWADAQFRRGPIVFLLETSLLFLIFNCSSLCILIFQINSSLFSTSFLLLII